MEDDCEIAQTSEGHSGCTGTPVSQQVLEKKTVTGSAARHWATIRGLERASCGGARGEDSEI